MAMLSRWLVAAVVLRVHGFFSSSIHQACCRRRLDTAAKLAQVVGTGATVVLTTKDSIEPGSERYALF